MLEAPSIIILSFNLTHLKYGHLFSVGWRNWKVMQKKKKQSMSSDEKKTNWALWYIWQTPSHTLLAERFCGQISLSSLWRQLLWQKPRLLPAWLPSLPFSTKILSRRLAPTQWQTNYIKAFPPLREQNSFIYQYQDKLNGFVIVIF